MTVHRVLLLIAALIILVGQHLACRSVNPLKFPVLIPTATMTLTLSATPSITPTYTASPTPSVTATRTISPTPTSTPTPSDTPTHTPTGTPTDTPTCTFTPTHTATIYPNATPYPTVSCGAGPVSIGRSTLNVSSPLNAGLLSYTRVTLSQAVSLSHMSFNVQWLNSPATLQMGIYTETAGAPASLFGQTASTGLVGGYNTFPLAAPVQLCPGSYWISFSLQTTGGFYGFDNSAPVSTLTLSSGFTPGLLPTSAPQGAIVNATGHYLIGIICPDGSGTCP